MTTPVPPVVFVYADFIAQYPEFASVSSGAMTGYFARASLYFANNASNLNGIAGGDINVMTLLMYLATAHVAWLSAMRDLNGNPSSTGTQPPPAIVGRINSAGEGSVNVSAEWKGEGSPSQDWWLQSQYGASFWEASAPARIMRYIAHPTFVSTFPFGRRFGGPFC
jgi:hypothetical protein